MLSGNGLEMFFSDWSNILNTLAIGVIAYVTLIFLLRISGKRTLSKWNAFDAVVTVALGSLLATATLSPSTTLVQGMTAFGLFVLLQLVITHGEPKTLEDLDKHVIITGGVISTSEWRMMNRGRPRDVKILPRLTAATAETAISAALTGFGLTSVLAYKVDEYLRDARLKAVLRDFEPPPLPVHVVHREGRHASHRARAFIDLAVERLRAIPALSGVGL